MKKFRVLFLALVVSTLNYVSSASAAVETPQLCWVDEPQPPRESVVDGEYLIYIEFKPNSTSAHVIRALSSFQPYLAYYSDKRTFTGSLDNLSPSESTNSIYFSVTAKNIPAVGTKDRPAFKKRVNEIIDSLRGERDGYSVKIICNGIMQQDW
jgi:hypothetical protein